MEDKQVICNLLAETLKNTRMGESLTSLIYDSKIGAVFIVANGAFKEKVNVKYDSGIAMIKDIMKANYFKC